MPELINDFLRGLSELRGGAEGALNQFSEDFKRGQRRIKKKGFIPSSIDFTKELAPNLPAANPLEVFEFLFGELDSGEQQQNDPEDLGPLMDFILQNSGDPIIGRNDPTVAPTSEDESELLSKLIESGDGVITVKGNRITKGEDKKKGFSRSEKSIGEAVKLRQQQATLLQQLQSLKQQEQIKAQAKNSTGAILREILPALIEDEGLAGAGGLNSVVFQKLMQDAGINIDLVGAARNALGNK